MSEPITAAGRALLEVFTTKPDDPDLAISVSVEGVVRHTIPHIEAEAFNDGVLAERAVALDAVTSALAAYRADLAAKVRGLDHPCHEVCVGTLHADCQCAAFVREQTLALIEGEPR